MPDEALPLIEVRLNAGVASERELKRSIRSVLAQREVRVAVTVIGGRPSASRTQGARDSGMGVSGGVNEPEYRLWLEAGSTLKPRALARLYAAAKRFSSDLVYPDATRRDGWRSLEIRRPDFSPLRLGSQDYLGDAVLLRADLAGAPPTRRSDVLRIALGLDPARIVHVPERLVVGATDAIRIGAGGLPLEDAARQVPTQRQDDGLQQADPPSVSIIIPTRGSSASLTRGPRVLVVEAVRSVLERSSYPAFDVVIVADDATPQSVIDALVEFGDRVSIVRWSQPFNFSAKINRGAAHSRGQYLLILNDDVEVITSDWIETLVGLGQQPGVGLVGATLLFEDGTVQHAGHFYRARGADHVAFGWPVGHDDALGSLSVDREVSGVTAACALVERALFERVGGFSTLLPGNYNDVDFSFKIRAAGARVIWTPRARLYHFESQSRDAATAPSELNRIRERWGTRMETDGYWSDKAVPRRMSPSSRAPDRQA